MTLDKNATPLPNQPLTPIQVETADWLDLPANSDEEIVEFNLQEQVFEVNEVGARPETDVDIVLIGESQVAQRQRSSIDRETIETEAIDSFGNVADFGPFATQRFQWLVDNGSGTDYTQASANDPYQTHLNYTIRDLTISDKLRRGISLGSQFEEDLAQRYGLVEQNNLGLPGERSPVLETNFEDKAIAEDEGSVEVFNINNSGETAGVNLADENNLRNRSLVAYLTGVSVNTQNYTLSGGSIFADDLTLDVERDGREFFKLELPGLPGLTGSNYEAEMFIPFTESMNVNIYSPNQTPLDVKVQLEYKLVRRTLLEKAIHGLGQEVEDGTREAEVYNELRRRIVAGVEVEDYIESLPVRGQNNVGQ